MFVNSAQKLFTYMGYYANTFARMSFRSIEQLTRKTSERNEHWNERGARVKQVCATVVSIPFTLVLFIPAVFCYVLSGCVGRGRFELIESKSSSEFWEGRSIKVMSLNACFQDPWSPLTGGVVTPFEPVADFPSRIAAVVDAITTENPDVFLGQEFENLDTQNKCIQLMQKKGYRYFLRDLGSNHPVCNNSGLFVASKIPLKDIKFVPYPPEARTGLAKWSAQGTLMITVCLNGKDIRLINVHLNYGRSEENQEGRNRQLKNYVVPLLKKGNAALFGDLNFNTASVDAKITGLVGFTNAMEGQVTCTDEGKHTLRGKSMTPRGKRCGGCEEQIDGLIYNKDKIQVLESHIKQLRRGGQLLSDHSAIIATIQPIE